MHKKPFTTRAGSRAGRTAAGSASGRVSVVIPAFNAAATIEKTVLSVMKQSYPDLEILVVDDGSTDETATIIRRLAEVDRRIRLLQKANGGLVSARNHGIAHSAGEFIAPVDADDLWHPDKIMKQVVRIRQAGDRVGLIYVWGRGIDECDGIVKDLPPCHFQGDVYAALIIVDFVGSGAPLVRRRCVEEVGGYDATLASKGAPCCEDYKFSLDVAERYHFDLVPEFLWGYRFRAGSMSSNLEAMLRSHLLVLDDAQRRHPELPIRIFRWARAAHNLKFAWYNCRQGRFPRGALLLIRALSTDPVGVLRESLRHVLVQSAMSRQLNEFAAESCDVNDGERMSGRNFFDLEPTASSDRSKTSLSRRRLGYIMRLKLDALGHASSQPLEVVRRPART